MNKEEREAFLSEKPSYSCRFHPTDSFHEVGCPHRQWEVADLQQALDCAKRTNELHVKLANESFKEGRQSMKDECLASVPEDESRHSDDSFVERFGTAGYNDGLAAARRAIENITP